MELLIFTANQTGNKKNCYYSNRVVAKNAAELQKAVMMDHVCAEYRNDYRSNANFMQSVVVVMDCDNDHSELPGDWMTPDKLKSLLPTVAFAIAPSRNNMKEKDGKPKSVQHLLSWAEMNCIITLLSNPQRTESFNFQM